MPRKLLQRCAVCGKFGAYCVPESGKGYWCYSCWYADWKAKHTETTPTPPTPAPVKPYKGKKKTASPKPKLPD